MPYEKRSINEMKREVRFIAELRADAGDEMALVGYAALFNNESKDLGGFRETIAPGAFTRSLADNADVKCLFNHNPDFVLGRTVSGTLTLKQDDKGLQFRCLLDANNQDHRNLHASVKRGDINECSFAFTIPKGGQQWAEAKDSNGDFYAQRTIITVNLMDVSAVTYPAYDGTSVAARSLFPEGDAEIRSAIASLKAPKAENRSREDSFESQYWARIDKISKALLAKFGFDGDGYCRKFYLWESYADHVIVCAYDEEYKETFSSIPYTVDENGEIVFGEPAPVELDWVPSERSKAAAAEIRAAHVAAKDKKKAEARNHLENIAATHQATADEAAATAKAHKDAADAIAAKAAEQKAYREEYGLLEDEDYEDNHFVDPDDIYGDDDDDDDDVDQYGANSAKIVAEARAKGEKVRTKTVGGKHLTAQYFAFVGDPDDTSTWKLPIHDAAHVRNALARFNQTKGIPADKKPGVLSKIKAAAKKFDIEVSDDDSRSLLAGTPFTEDEIRAIRAKAAGLMLN
jgi:HK97 family phage prohead protease